MVSERELRIERSFERVGGALERVLSDLGWHVDAVDRESGILDAGKRGWFGYRTVSCRLVANGSETTLSLKSSLKMPKLQEIIDTLSRALELGA